MVEHPAEKLGLMTIEEFVRLYDLEGPFEVIGGERRPVSPTVAGHNTRAKRVYDALVKFDPNQTIGYAYFETAYVLLYRREWVKGARVPDVLFIRAERWSAYIADNPDWEDKPLIIVPDVAVEVISANDNYSDVDEKVDLYLEDGVQRVWVLDPRRKVVTVRGKNLYNKLTLEDSLSGGESIPGFELAVRDIFE